MARRPSRTYFVTGKGGTGKSQVAGTLSREAARRGLRVALVEAATDEPLTPAQPQPGRFAHLELDPHVALRRLLGRLLRFGFLGDRLMDSRTFSAVAAAAPGLYDLVRLDYLREIAEGGVCGALDLVVVDAPASGHGVALLEAPRRIADLIPVGPAATIARAARDYVCDPERFEAVVVSLPEDLAVAETAELHAELARLGIRVAPTIVNGVYPQQCTAAEEQWLRAHAPASPDALLYLDRRERQIAQAKRIASPAGSPLLLPFEFSTEPVDAGDAERLFDALVRAA